MLAAPVFVALPALDVGVASAPVGLLPAEVSAPEPEPEPEPDPDPLSVLLDGVEPDPPPETASPGRLTVAALARSW
jgi:hypothetical protein